MDRHFKSVKSLKSIKLARSQKSVKLNRKCVSTRQIALPSLNRKCVSTRQITLPSLSKSRVFSSKQSLGKLGSQMNIEKSKGRKKRKVLRFKNKVTGKKRKGTFIDKGVFTFRPRKRLGRAKKMPRILVNNKPIKNPQEKPFKLTLKENPKFPTLTTKLNIDEEDTFNLDLEKDPKFPSLSTKLNVDEEEQNKEIFISEKAESKKQLFLPLGLFEDYNNSSGSDLSECEENSLSVIQDFEDTEYTLEMSNYGCTPGFTDFYEFRSNNS